MSRTVRVPVALYLAGLLVFARPVSMPSEEQNAAGNFDNIATRAAAARMEHRFEQSIELYKEALKLRPSWGEGWWYLGTLFYETEHYEEALTPFARLAEARPQAGPAWAMLGLCEFQLGRYQRAMGSLQRGLALGLEEEKGLAGVTRFHVAVLHNRLGNPDAALPILYSVAREQGQSPPLLEALGLCALALPYLPGELRDDKRELVLKTGRAQYFLALRKIADARREYEELIDRYPNTSNVHYSFGVFLLGQDEPELGLTELRRELEISPAHIFARLQIAFEYIKRGEYTKALPYAQEAVKIAPHSLAARNAMARTLLGMSKAPQAVEELEIAVKIDPENSTTWYTLAQAYARAGRKDDAARARAEFKRLDNLRNTSQEGLPQAEAQRPHP